MMRVLFFLLLTSAPLIASPLLQDSSLTVYATEEEYEQLLLDSENNLRSLSTNSDILEELFKPVSDQKELLKKQLARSEQFRRAEAFLLVLLAVAFLSVGYLIYALIQLRKRGAQLKFREKEFNAILSQILPSSVLDRILITKEFDPNIWKDCLVLSIRFDRSAAFRDVKHRMHVMGDIIEICNRNMDQFGLQKIKSSGPKLLAVFKVNRVTPQQQLQGTMSCVHKIISEVGEIDKGYIEVKTGIGYGDVVSGLVGKEHAKFDIWGAAVDEATRLSSAAGPQQILASREVSRVAPSARIKNEFVGEESIENIEMYQLS
jgi:hypothetical protein